MESIARLSACTLPRSRPYNLSLRLARPTATDDPDSPTHPTGPGRCHPLWLCPPFSGRPAGTLVAVPLGARSVQRDVTITTWRSHSALDGHQIVTRGSSHPLRVNRVVMMTSPATQLAEHPRPIPDSVMSSKDDEVFASHFQHLSTAVRPTVWSDGQNEESAWAKPNDAAGADAPIKNVALGSAR